MVTAPERLAKVAEVQRRHGGYKSAGVGRGWLCWCDAPLSAWWPEGGVGPRESALDVALRAHLNAALAPLLGEFQAEDEARVRAEYEFAITWDTTCLNCAKLLDKLYGEWSEGHKAGVREGAARVREAVEALTPMHLDEWPLTGEWLNRADVFAALDAAEKESHDG